MPKSFSDNERAYIRKRLIEEAQVCLGQLGLRKTTVDELVKRVNIAKGTFYLFYPSKEMLFFDLFCTLHDELQNTLLQWISDLQGNINADTITDLLFRLYQKTDSTFLYAFISSGDLELMVRKLPPEIAAEHAKKDDFHMDKLLSLLPGVSAKNSTVFGAVLRAIFCSTLHKREIGEDVYDDAIRVLLRGAVKQLFEGEEL